MKTLIYITTIGLALSCAKAHDFALTPGMGEEGKIAVSGLYGHPGTWEQPDIRRLVALDVHAVGESHPTSILDSVKPSTAGNLRLAASGDKPVKAAGVIITATYDNGYWVSTGESQYFNTTKKMAPAGLDIVKSSHNTKFAKLMLENGPGFDRSVGQRLEIVPQNDPAKLAKGEELVVQVLFDGKPLAGVEVNSAALDESMSHDEENLPKTDGAGKVRIDVAKTGMNLIRASHSVESVDPELADHDNFSATLVLRFGPAPSRP
ncbi:MAG: DUF4198 domain-containing protein [Verrucomicrobiales bacterium]|nr:DUF4198 domain-containing protein [Verrucomicrobiales bacterium]